MLIGIGADHNAFKAKEELKKYIETLGHEVKDYGCYSADDVDYPGIAFKTAEGVKNEEVERGILICGTGVGMAISANKIKGIRAAQVHDPFSAERAQLSNNAQVITFGSKVIGVDVMKLLTKEYLSHTFQGGNSERKVQQIIDKEQSADLDSSQSC
ncbi:MAG: RpiB/LacA/LacB family sugar-phosphate isomerase [Alkalibacterium sp.]|nr:RpiB/LacA/LacB family sugar-phosphate isomerase [Alkalibacterium sp.]